jgi:hypothetical protein
MTTHWEQGWISFQHAGHQVVLRDEGDEFSHALVELQLIHEATPVTPAVPPEVHDIFNRLTCWVDMCAEAVLASTRLS